MHETVINTAKLVDIASIQIDTTQSKERRIADFVEQIKNPYLYKCGKFTIIARFAENGGTFEDCVAGILRSK